jgi:iron complex outermembrane recepter protein
MMNRLLLLCLFFMATSTVFAQKMIEGRVTDAATGEPLADVNVLEKSPKGHSTKTDAYGNFKLEVASNSTTLIISIPGFSKREVSIGKGEKLRIALSEASGLTSETVMVIGSRDQTSGSIASPVAVDVISVTQVINQTGQIELNQILNFVAPSFNAHHMSGQDLADHVNPSSLRGMGPDQVLFLINGKRMNPSTVVNIFGVRGRGNSGSDLSNIPAAAVERIEILRDGAAAQYGSDAVAGVVNIVLKSNIKGTIASVQQGAHATGYGTSLNYEGLNGKIIPRTLDGQQTNVAVTHGIQIGKGNITITGNFLSKLPTQRPNNTDVFTDESYRDYSGEAAYKSYSAFIAGNLPTQKGEWYFSGGYNYRNTLSYIWNIPFEDSTRNVYEIFNKPYHPELQTDMSNTQLMGGFRTKLGKWRADISQTFGTNDVHIHTRNTLNPSLGVSSPTEFENGSFHLYQYSTDLDFSRKFDKVMQGFNVAFGGVFRYENYNIHEGDEASWETYDNPPFQITNPDGTKSWVTKVGTSQGFPGFRPEQEVDAGRFVTGIYTDAELSLTKKFLVTGALRFENYSDFGNAFGSKLAARYIFSPKFYVRGSLQTGFRAPSLTQIYFQSTINDVDAEGNNFEKVIFNNKSELTRRLGVPQLKAERSVNQGFGMVFTPNPNVNFAIDGYHVDVQDRIILTGTFKDNDDVIGADLKALNVLAGQFFTNALDTRTIGLDVTARFKQELGRGKLNLTLAGNINKMSVLGLNPIEKLKNKTDIYLSPRELQFILASAPNYKFHSMVNYEVGKLALILRGTLFGSTKLVGTDGVLGFDPDLDNKYYNNRREDWYEAVNDVYKPRFVTDLIVNFDMTNKIKLTVGGNNIFDVYPTIQNSGSTDGGNMWDSVQMGQAGAYFFGKLTWHFGEK